MNIFISFFLILIAVYAGLYLGLNINRKQKIYQCKVVLEKTTKYIKFKQTYKGKEYNVLIFNTNKEIVMMQEIFDAHLVIKNNILIKNNPEITGYKKEIGTKITNQELINEFGIQTSFILEPSTFNI